jgi:hypothetical protein
MYDPRYIIYTQEIRMQISIEELSQRIKTLRAQGLHHPNTKFHNPLKIRIVEDNPYQLSFEMYFFDRNQLGECPYGEVMITCSAKTNITMQNSLFKYSIIEIPYSRLFASDIEGIDPQYALLVFGSFFAGILLFVAFGFLGILLAFFIWSIVLGYIYWIVEKNRKSQYLTTYQLLVEILNGLFAEGEVSPILT